MSPVFNSLTNTTISTGGGGGINSSTTNYTTLTNTKVSSYQTSIGYNEPKFTINQDSNGTWHVTVTTKNKKFIRGILQTLLNDCAELELEESIEITKKLNGI